MWDNIRPADMNTIYLFASQHPYDGEGWDAKTVLFEGNPERGFLAFDNNRFIGGITVRTTQLEKFTCNSYLCGVFVLPSHRGKGIAIGLVYSAVSSLVEEGLSPVGVSIQSDNMEQVINKFEQAYPELFSQMLVDNENKKLRDAMQNEIERIRNGSNKLSQPE